MDNEIQQSNHGRMRQEEQKFPGGRLAVTVRRTHQSSFRHLETSPLPSDREEVRILTQKEGKMYLKAIEVRQYYDNRPGYKVLKRTEINPPQQI